MTDPDTDGGGSASPRERREAALTHGAALLMFFLPLGNVAGPLALWWTWGRRSPFVAGHASKSAAYQAVISLAAWTLFLFARLHGLDPDAHLVVLLLSLALPLRAAGRALAGREPGYPWIG